MQDDNDDTKMFYVFLAVQFLDIYTKTFTHIYNRYSLLTIQYNYYLLFIKWRGIIVKVFVVAFFTLSRLRKRGKRWGQSCCLSNGRSERGGAGGREGERGNISGNKTSWKYILISVCFFFFFHFSKNVSMWDQSFRHLLSFQCLYHRRVNVVKEVKGSVK